MAYIRHDRSLCVYNVNTETWSRDTEVPEWVDTGSSLCRYKTSIVVAGSMRRKDAAKIIRLDRSSTGTAIYTYNQVALPALPQPMRKVGIIHTGEWIYVIGGERYEDNQWIASASVIKLKDETWIELSPLQRTTVSPTLLSIQAVIYVFSGQKIFEYKDCSINRDHSQGGRGTDVDAGDKKNSHSGVSSLLARTFGVKRNNKVLPKDEEIPSASDNYSGDICTEFRDIPRECHSLYSGTVLYNGQLVLMTSESWMRYMFETNEFITGVYQEKLEGMMQPVVYDGQLAAAVQKKFKGSMDVMLFNIKERTWNAYIKDVPSPLNIKLFFTM